MGPWERKDSCEERSRSFVRVPWSKPGSDPRPICELRSDTVSRRCSDTWNGGYHSGGFFLLQRPPCPEKRTSRHGGHDFHHKFFFCFIGFPGAQFLLQPWAV